MTNTMLKPPAYFKVLFHYRDLVHTPFERTGWQLDYVKPTRLKPYENCPHAIYLPTGELVSSNLTPEFAKRAHQAISFFRLRLPTS